jgi:hypothetical protein
MPTASRPYQDDPAVLATMHGKQRVIAPLLERALGLRVTVSRGIDTDRFGTFSRDVERTGSQLDAARAKIAAAFAQAPEATVALASEGSFGPHPYIPFLPLAREIVVLADRAAGLELIGHHASPTTNFSHEVVSDVSGARAFGDCAGFPEHGVIVMGVTDGQPAPARALIKDIQTPEDLANAVTHVIGMCGMAFVETDMRAHRNPTRMRAIKGATLDLVRKFRSPCPKCAAPGFAISERLSGLPCSWCGGPSQAVRADVLSCPSCGHRVERAVVVTSADPGQCPDCNP